jgi:hypothetical protein
MTGNIVDIIPLYPHQPSNSIHTHYRLNPDSSQFWIVPEITWANKLWASLEPEDLPKYAAIQSDAISAEHHLVRLAARAWLSSIKEHHDR